MSTNPVIAISQARIINTPESHETMMRVGPKVCITTASHPGFLGFEQLIQTGVHALGGRYGGGSISMGERLNPTALYQYTVWKDVASHEEMHHDNFATLYELCSSCLSMVVEGPWEVYYEVLASDLPPLVAMTDIPNMLGTMVASKLELPKIALALQRTTLLGDHWIMQGHEMAFEQGVVDTLEWMQKEVPGMIGWMVLKQFGVSAIGSFQFDPEGMHNATLGANPPAYRTNYGSTVPTLPLIPPQTPSQYLVHIEWTSPELAHIGLGYLMVEYELRQIHNEGVLRHLDRGPYYMVFSSMMEQGLWRKKLVR